MAYTPLTTFTLVENSYVPSTTFVLGAATAALSGTATATIDESDIVVGGKTIIITLTGDTFVADGAAFDAQRQAIINGLNGI